jgi:protein-L-isoaspartate(D-aspartate) O-methyltransferase
VSLTCPKILQSEQRGDVDEEVPMTAADRSRERRALRRMIEQEVERTERFTGRRRLDPRVLEVMARVPRERFVPAEQMDSAYANVPLPIGHRQTISQPYIVALMTDLLETRPQHKVLEIGTGSGYQAAVLAELVASVYTVEVIPALAAEATGRLAELGYDNVFTRAGDGNLGWPEQAPFDGIIVTAGAPRIPLALLAQLKPGGRLVIPVNSGGYGQLLQCVTRDAAGDYHTEDVLPVMFVPLVDDPPDPVTSAGE